jgi:flagellar protein FliS
MNYASESATGLSPIGLVVRLYENIVSDLGRAILAVREDDVEKRTSHLQHALLLIAHLQSALDMKNGGDSARLLERFYMLARKRIVEAQGKQSIELMEEISREFLSVREAWAQIEDQQAVSNSDGKPRDAHVSCVA